MRDHDSAFAAGRVPVPALGWGALGVVAFSMTLPATRAALPAFGPITVGVGRAVPAAALAGAALLLVRAPLPTRAQAARLLLVAAGAVLGFPVFTALALRGVGAAHGAVLVGLLPAATAVAAVLRAGERPRPAFWLAAAGGAASVLAFAAVRGAGTPRPADLLLLAAVASAAVAYAEGGALAREMPGSRVISWALVLALPAVLPIAAAGLIAHPPAAPGPAAWAGLAYVSGISMFAGFVAWYRGLALGGVARISQLQLAQPVLTVAWSAVLLHEAVDTATVAAALVVLLLTAATQRTRDAAPVPGTPAENRERPAPPGSMLAPMAVSGGAKR
jgi:drug/metabolite transporter (DMT)-like permease